MSPNCVLVLGKQNYKFHLVNNPLKYYYSLLFILGKLRLHKVQLLAQAHLVISELCELGKLHKPQLQRSKESDLSMTTLT